MPEITNPLGAYGQTATSPRTVYTFKAAGAISALNTVYASTETVIKMTSTRSTDSQMLTVGVALNAATTGQAVQVAVGGIVKAVPVDGTVGAGDILHASGTTDGSLAATATPALGEGIGVALAASASNVATVWIAKNMVKCTT